MQPSNGAGKMKVILTPESGEVLNRVGGIKKWLVMPTMTRGARKMGGPLHCNAAAAKSKAKAAKATPKGSAAKALKISKMVKKKKKDKKAKVPKVVSLSVGEITDTSFRRNVAGRQSVTVMIKKLYESDQQAFPSAPVFAADGSCRMKFPGASEFKWDEIVESAPKAVENMPLVCTQCISKIIKRHDIVQRYMSL